MEKIKFNIPSISCSSCSAKIQDGISAIKGVGNVSADLKSQSIEVQYDPSLIKPQDISRKISDMGYEVLV
jgi:copper chaperone